MKTFLRNRLIETLGFAIFSFGLFLLLAFFSANVNDSSLNELNNNPIQNYGGYIGAYFAVPLKQFIGLSSYYIALLVITWGIVVIIKKNLPLLWFRLLMLIFGIITFCFLFSFVDFIALQKPSWASEDKASFGGYIGLFLQRKILFIDNIFYSVFVFLVALAVCFLSFYLASSISRQFYFKIIKYVSINFYKLVKLVYRLLKQIRRRKPEVQPEEPKEKEGKFKILNKLQKAKVKKTPIQEELQLGAEKYILPSFALLQEPKGKIANISESALMQNANMLEKVLGDFGVKGKIVEINPGPVVTLYALEPAAGTKSSRVIGLADDIARSLSAVSARIAIVSGQNAIGIELPNSTRQTVFLREVFEAEAFKGTKATLPLSLGKDLAGNPFVIDLAKTPHLLVAGTTGSGKSVGINAMILSLLYKFKPDECKFIMIDPKMLELSVYQDIPHLLSPVVTEPKKAVIALKWVVKEMEARYKLMSSLGVRNIFGYNEKIVEAIKQNKDLFHEVQTGFNQELGTANIEKIPLPKKAMPFIVVIVDEMADLMLVAGKEIETSVQRLAQMARAAGIHIILATQRPSVDVITGVIKANFPSRISFQVTSKIDSRTILGEQGAEQLLGMGDMLYMAGGGKITRVHGPFVSDAEVERVAAFVRKQAKPEYVEDVTISDDPEEQEDASNEDGGDEMYQRAKDIVLREKKVSVSYIQRMLKIGYNRSANIVEQLERNGIVSEPDHTGKRKVLD